jgi:hypothetical protein
MSDDSLENGWLTNSGDGELWIRADVSSLRIWQLPSCQPCVFASNVMPSRASRHGTTAALRYVDIGQGRGTLWLIAYGSVSRSVGISYISLSAEEQNGQFCRWNSNEEFMKVYRRTAIWWPPVKRNVFLAKRLCYTPNYVVRDCNVTSRCSQQRAGTIYNNTTAGTLLCQTLSNLSLMRIRNHGINQLNWWSLNCK